MSLHRDELNEGLSLCFAVGNYSGGELVLCTSKGDVKHNIRGRILEYDGLIPHYVDRIYPHGDMPMERFSFVVYQRKINKRSTPIDEIELEIHWVEPASGQTIKITSEKLLDMKGIPEEQKPGMIEAAYKEIQGSSSPSTGNNR